MKANQTLAVVIAVSFLVLLVSLHWLATVSAASVKDRVSG